ncbi:MAG: aminomethyl-transferring glycine dehydrogenase subunit GcvPA [Candidatus Lokiarchaeota archaeon]|nr:aminomethyl-transferring glycine dehydrogenase subunit GcvPA [Candidatus Lokiarchaeota archaeon]
MLIYPSATFSTWSPVIRIASRRDLKTILAVTNSVTKSKELAKNSSILSTQNDLVVFDMEWTHPWLPITYETQNQMLEAISKEKLDDLFCNIPDKFRLKRDLKLPTSHSEYEVAKRLQELASKNHPADNGRVFIGSGVYPHYIPHVVPALAGRSEFVTSYTSYQPEISQGMLQTLFEYQSMLAEILQIEVVNSSMYDMATALGEAARMTARVNKKRDRFLIPSSMNPEFCKVLQTYTEPADIEVEQIDYDKNTGLMDLSDLESRLNEDVAGVYLENPSYLGFIETQVDAISKMAHDAGALLVAGVDILSLGLLRPPGEYGADIVIAEGQPLGSPMSYGGPLLGIFGCKMERKLVYQMPGRLVGLTRTEEEPYERGYVLTLSPREQHIRREKATSNICSNQALAAVTAAVYLSTIGPTGLYELSKSIAYKSNYVAKKLNEISGVVSPAIGDSIWREFVVQFNDGVSAEDVHDALLANNLHGGKILSTVFPELGESMLLCVTELHDLQTIEELIETISGIFQNGGA